MDERTETFARLRLSGARFEDQGMPVSSLVELVAYQELILGVAKARFRHLNPARRRVPKRFGDRLQLRIRSVEQGSVVPVLERVRMAQELPLTDEFDEARELIAGAVAAVAAGAPLPDAFPRDALVLFNRFGQSLEDDEAIELRSGTAPSGPRYSRSVRRQLLLTNGSYVQQEVHVIGWVTEIDAVRMSCTIRLYPEAPSYVRGPLDEVTFGPVKELLTPNGEGPMVAIVGTGVFNADGRLLRLDSIHDISASDPNDEDLAKLNRRLSQLAALEIGWLDGDGAPPTQKALSLAERVLTELLAMEVPSPRAFPTPDGGIQAEWTIGHREVSVTFEPHGSLYALSVNTASGTSDERVLDSEDVGQITRFVLRAS